MENTFSALTSYIPADLNMPGMLKFIVIFAFLSIFIGLVGRVIFGIRSEMNHSVSVVLGIFFIYVLTVLIYTFDVKFISKLMVPLPFINITDETLYLFSFKNATFTVICSQVLSMFLLALMVSFLDMMVPKDKAVKMPMWYGLRIVSLVASVILYTVASKLINAHMPELLVQYAPVVFVSLLAAMLLLAASKVILAPVLIAANPLIGVLYTFFFTKMVGKQLSKASFSTILFSVLLLVLEHFGFAAISISTAALVTYLPLIAALLALWYLIGHIL